MKKYYQYLETVPTTLLDDFVAGNVAPFVGAGFSKNADIPAGLTVPDWNELGQAAASKIPGYKYNGNALHALTYFENYHSRRKLVEFLIQELHQGYISPGPTYKAFCDVFEDIVFTTNFDSLLEDAYKESRKPVSSIVTSDRLTLDVKGETRIVKLHGDFNHPDKMVITEGDYDNWAINNPQFVTYTSYHFITKTVLLIGYSLDDFDIRRIWSEVKKSLGSMARTPYCIMVGASPEKLASFASRNVKVINLPGDSKNYKTILHDFFVEVRQYIDEKRKAETTRKVPVSQIQGFSIGSLSNYGCLIHSKESIENNAVATIDFSSTDADLCTIVFHIEDRNWTTHFRAHRELCFEISSDTCPISIEVEAQLKDRIRQIPISVSDKPYTYRIPLMLFSPSEKSWVEIREVCFLFHRELIHKKVTVAISNLRLEE